MEPNQIIEGQRIPLPTDVLEDISYYELLRLTGQDYRFQKIVESDHSVSTKDITKLLRPASVANFPKKLGNDFSKRAVLQIDTEYIPLKKTITIYLVGGIKKEYVSLSGVFKYDPIQHDLEVIDSNKIFPHQLISPGEHGKIERPLDVIVVSYSPESKIREDKLRIEDERNLEMKSCLAAGATCQALSQGIISARNMGFKLSYHLSREKISEISELLRLPDKDRYRPRTILSVGYIK